MAYSDDLTAEIASIALSQIDEMRRAALCEQCRGDGLVWVDDPDARSGVSPAPCPVCSCSQCGTELPWHFGPCPKGCDGVDENGNDLPVAASIERDAGGYL